MELDYRRQVSVTLSGIGHPMNHTTDEDHQQDAAILDLAVRLLDTARSLNFAVKAGMVEDYDFQLLRSELEEYYQDAGRIARRVQGR